MSFDSSDLRRLAMWLGVLALMACRLVLSPASAAAAPANYDGISADGKVAVFSTSEQMLSGDTDPTVDIFERTLEPSLDEYVTRQVSLGPFGGNDTLPATFDGISSDGSEVFFSTRERLVSADKDLKIDIYVRNFLENKTYLASEGRGCGSPCGNGPADASFVPNGVPFEGGRVFFSTTEVLSPADQDEASDIYVHDMQTKTTELVSGADASCLKSKCGSLANNAQFQGTDAAGDKAFFTTVESLVEGDLDTSLDIYERDLQNGETKLVSGEGECPAGFNCNPTFRAVSPDGSHVFFESLEQLSVDDSDSAQDVYAWSGGQPVLVSVGSGGTNGSSNVTFAGSSSDGSAVYFETDDPLDVAVDTDNTQDVYVRSGGTTQLVSAGESADGNNDQPATFEWASRAGATAAVFFSTREQLTDDDNDTALDVYKRSGGVTTLASTGPEGGDGQVDSFFRGASQDGSKVLFSTAESLVSEDEDSSTDVYLNSGAETILVSGGQIGGNGAFAAEFRAVSDDGGHVYFNTQERLAVDDDFASEEDVYGWSTEGTRLISAKNSADLVLGPPPPALEGTKPPSPNPSTTPAIFGQATAGAAIKIYASFDCSGEPMASGNTEELATGLTVEVPVALGSTTNYRATAESEGVVSACSSPISYKQEDPAPVGGEGTGSGGGGGESSGGDSPATSGGTSGTSSGGGGGSTTGGGSVGRHNGIAYVAPLVRITFAPGAKTRQRRPVFRFDDATEQPGTRFFCKLDKQRWAGCSSPFKPKRLKLGRHVFSLKAVNAVGVVGSPPTKRAFKVVHP
jgi:hypothetical protein